MSRIIKAGPDGAGGHRIEAELHDAAERAREVVARAEETARRIVAGAEEERTRLSREAEMEGREAGLGRAAAALAGAAAARDHLLAGAQGEVVALALDVARKVLGRELAKEPSAIVDLAARAVAAARERTAVAIRSNPADVPALREAEGRLAALLALAPGLALRPDPSVPRGSVVVETEAGRIDASVEAQIEALQRALEEP